jgi:hypothetical protein
LLKIIIIRVLYINNHILDWFALKICRALNLVKVLLLILRNLQHKIEMQRYGLEIFIPGSAFGSGFSINFRSGSGSGLLIKNVLDFTSFVLKALRILFQKLELQII